MGTFCAQTDLHPVLWRIGSRSLQFSDRIRPLTLRETAAVRVLGHRVCLSNECAAVRSGVVGARAGAGSFAQ